MNYLFLFSIGPVQSFISQARKTQDLFAGSKLLSALCLAGAEKLVTECGYDWGANNDHDKINKLLITPFFNTDREVRAKQSLPNRFLAKVSNEHLGQNTTNDLGTTVQKAVEVYWKNCKKEAFKELEIESPLPNSINEQIASHLNINWVFVPIKDDYSNAYIQVESTLSSFKQLKSFEQFNYQKDKKIFGEKGRKCIVDGERNVAIYRKNKNESKHNTPYKLFLADDEVIIIDNNKESKVPIWELSAGEGLSAVSFTKRKFLIKPHEFPSTAKVALMHLFDKVEKLPAYEKLKKKVEGKGNEKCFPHSDEELYFEDNITLSRFQKEGNFDTEESAQVACDEVLSLHQDLRKAMKEEGITDKFTKYYALVKSDGDDMGKWLRGAYLPIEKRNNLENFHTDLTRCLGDCAEKNSTGVTIPKGKTIYSAGEDFLGLFNLHSVFEELIALRTRFSSLVNEPIQNDWKNDKAALTISTGIVIAHYKEPLTEMVKLSDVLEQKVKQANKNGFAITIVKHSGSHISFVCPWFIDGEDMISLLQTVTQQLQTNFSSTFIEKLFDLRQQLAVPTGDAFDWEHEFMKAETKRLILRSNLMAQSENQSKEGFDTQKKKANDTMIGAIEKLLQMHASMKTSSTIEDNDYTDDLNPDTDLLNGLTICDFIARQTTNET